MSTPADRLKRQPQQWVDLATCWPHFACYYREALLVLAGYEFPSNVSRPTVITWPFNQFPIDVRARIRQHFLEHAK